MSLIQVPIANMGMVPFLEQYLGIWAIHTEALNALQHIASQIDIASHMNSETAANARATTSSRYRQDVQNVAVISIRGTMCKHVSSLDTGTSTALVRQEIISAANSKEVDAIVLVVDSPGGTVAGTQELANTVALAKTKKPVLAFLEDFCASAAYWVASQADELVANDSCLVGSIGTYGVVADYSAAAAQAGVKVHVIKAGEFKGVGIAGTEVTDKQIEMLQERIDDLNQFFVQGVADGRKMPVEKVQEIADGAVHIAAKAKKLGLIDSTGTLDSTIAKASAMAATKSKGKPTAAANPIVPTSQERPVSQETVQAPAAIEQLRAECVGATSDFILNQLAAAATVEQAKSAFIKEQSSLLAAKAAEAQSSQFQFEVTPKRTGIKSVPAPASVSCGSARDEWTSAVATFVSSGMSKMEAAKAADKQNPGLRERMVVEAQPA